MKPLFSAFFVFSVLALPIFAAAQQTHDLSVARGHYNADIKVLRRDGTLAAGEPYRLQLDVSGADPDIITGTIADDGIVRLKGLAGGDGGPKYLLLVGPRELEAERFRLDGAERHRALEFTMAPDVGDVAPDIIIQDLFTGEKRKLSNFRGRYVMLDFWASWCGPCHDPMQRLEAALAAHRTEWQGKVAAVALSIDDTPAQAKQFVDQRRWFSMNHFWSSEGEPGFFSDAQRAYRIEAIPTGFLISPEGVVLWRGSPVAENVERLIADALEATH